MEINRCWSMPNKNTFFIPPITALLQKYFVLLPDKAVVIDPFANNGCKELLKRNDLIYISNDLDKSCNTTHHLDSTDFLKSLKDTSVDMVLYDPPYSPRQVSECYKKLGQTVDMKTTQASYWSNQKKEIQRIVKPNGIVVTCAWNSGGIGQKYGFEIEEILLVPHGGWHNDTIITIERKVK